MAELKLADIGAGAAPLKVYASDKGDYPGVEHEDMEHLTYPDETFDIVHCRNALDHTKDAQQALKELIRICKPGGLVYIRCWLNQKDTGYKHYWNATEDGKFNNGKTTFNLWDYGFLVIYTETGQEPRYNYITAFLEKPL